eukprot:CAMPEP_0181043878 /NCGR_PEP_ID=MMETSP1070-20121207/12951_1 /TAXON_ID=265543 /ORGANISM="Minutocellus polymorphus, Strain NH13" /LENGTH=647 /DNA_ID=CAMNT_0023122253 /DNA_START=44 /DNA_END=1987 /DNA_ORIENTATION=+
MNNEEDVATADPSDMNDIDLEGDGPDASQLPSVEEVRTNQSLAPDANETKRRRKKCRVWSAIFLAAVLVALIIGISVAVSKSKSRSGGTAQSAAPPAPVPSPTASAPAPTQPAPTPVPEMTDAEREKAARAFLMTTGVSLEDDMTLSGSPQHKALKWISKEDTRRVPIPSNPEDLGTTKARKFVQRYALATFYYATEGDSWFYPFSFLSDKDECEWYEIHTEGEEVYFWGAHCEGGSDEGAVSQIWLPNNDMAGTIPQELEQFTNLRVFALEYNLNITGTLPDAFHSMSDLSVIVLSNNLIEGKIPSSFKKLSNLEFLAADDNQMEGNLNHIKELDTLKYVYLEDNFFTESLSDSTFDGWTKLKQLDLSDNEFSGTVPASLLNHEHLTVLDLHDNDLTGPIPEVSDKQDKLTYLALHKNSLSGPIPSTIKHLQGLTDLDLSHNQLTGDIQESLKHLNLVYLFLGENKFDANPVPAFLTGMTNLTELSLKHTNLHGSIPDSFGDLTDLYLLDLDKNKLTGTIPESLGNLDNLIVLMLNRNRLTGTVPESLGNLPALGVLLVDGNDGLSGSLDFMCTASGGNGTFFALAADCGGDAPTIDCSNACCNICCGNPDEKCDDMGWTANYDPIWELSYERYRFEFDMERRMRE